MAASGRGGSRTWGKGPSAFAQAAPRREHHNEVRVTLSLRQDSATIAVRFTYQAALIDLLKAHSGQFDRTREPGQWVVPVAEYLKLKAALESIDIRPQRVTLDGLSVLLWETLNNPGKWTDANLQHRPVSTEELMAVTHDKVPLELADKLLPYQRAGVLTAIQRHGTKSGCGDCMLHASNLSPSL